MLSRWYRNKNRFVCLKHTERFKIPAKNNKRRPIGVFLYQICFPLSIFLFLRQLSVGARYLMRKAIFFHDIILSFVYSWKPIRMNMNRGKMSFKRKPNVIDAPSAAVPSSLPAANWLQNRRKIHT